MHWLLRLLCSQITLPSQTLHLLLSLLCSQMLLPSQTLHLLLIMPWSQRPLPPQSLHWLFCLPCSQRPLPPQSLHLLFCLPCSHGLDGIGMELPGLQPIMFFDTLVLGRPYLIARVMPRTAPSRSSKTEQCWDPPREARSIRGSSRRAD